MGYGAVILVAGLTDFVARPFSTALQGSFPPFVIFTFAILGMILATRPLYLVFNRRPDPIRQLVTDVKDNAAWFVSIAILCWALPTSLDAATTLKKAIPLNQPFYADPLLIEIDRMVFGGKDAWQLTHAIFGTWATRFIDAAYTFWVVAQILLGIGIILARDLRFKIQVALTFQLSWALLGAGLATFSSSVGPCFLFEFYSDRTFLPLMEELRSVGNLGALAGMEYLLASQGTNSIGSGISAMPSLHVGISVIIALCIREKAPRLQWLGWGYLAIMYIGSIHLGWHYASDGVVSGVLVAALWYGVRFLVNWAAKAPAKPVASASS